MSNCQDGCQTNSRRYDDLLSTDRVDLSNTYRVIVLVMGLGHGGATAVQPNTVSVFTVQRYASAVCAVAVCLCVCVCPLHAGIVSKRLNVGSHFKWLV